MGARTRGWYADPVTVGAARFRDGRAWIRQLAWGGQARMDPSLLADVARREEQSLVAIIDDHLADAGRRHLVAPAAIHALRADLDRSASPRESRPLPARFDRWRRAARGRRWSGV